MGNPNKLVTKPPKNGPPKVPSPINTLYKAEAMSATISWLNSGNFFSKFKISSGIIGR